MADHLVWNTLNVIQDSFCLRPSNDEDVSNNIHLDVEERNECSECFDKAVYTEPHLNKDLNDQVTMLYIEF